MKTLINNSFLKIYIDENKYINSENYITLNKLKYNYGNDQDINIVTDNANDMSEFLKVLKYLDFHIIKEEAES